MKLIVKKDQDVGMLGKVKFIINAKVSLTDEESALVKKYNVKKEVLFSKNNFMQTEITIGSLIDGETFSCKTIEEILKFEEIIKKSCQNLKIKLDTMKSFGGEYEIDYTS